MSEEERQRQMDFIVNQQATSEERMAKIEDVVARLANLTLDRFAQTGVRLNDVDAKISALVDAQIKSDEKISALADAQRNLTAVVDRYFSEGRNGKP